MKEGANIYNKAVTALDARAKESGQSLDEICKDVAAVYATEEDDRDLRRFLYRLGHIRSTVPGPTYEKRLNALLEQAEAKSGAPNSQVLAVLRAFSSGTPSSPDLAVCGDQPDCLHCGLRDDCHYYQRGPTIRARPESERPRERLIQDGEEALSPAELLAIIIRDGTPRLTAVDLGHKIIERFGELRNLSICSIDELCEIDGIGPAKAVQIKAALAMGQRAAQTKALQRGEPVCTSEDIFEKFHPLMRDRKREEFRVILLDRKNCVIRDVSVSIGSLTASIVHPREVLNPAVRDSAAAIICVHNHPSGDPVPSAEDREVTRRLNDAGKILGISLLDHIIIGDGRYFSFADEGLIKTK